MATMLRVVARPLLAGSAAWSAVRGSLVCMPCVAESFSETRAQKQFFSSGKVIPVTNSQGAAFPKDLRSTSGLGKGDDLDTHTSKWLSEGEGPMELINKVPPMAVQEKIVACRGGGHPSLGHPVEFIKVYGTTMDDPAVCKYCGLRYCYDGSH